MLLSRLPRKYSSDKHRTTSAPIVGSSGSTPLHFAAANGHEQVVLTLLLHGAHPDRPDKHGVTPEAVARQNGWARCAEILSKWTHEKDRDLREREAVSGAVSAPAPESDSVSIFSKSEFESKIREKRLKVKSSIDNAMNMLKPPFPTPPSSGTLPHEGSYTMSPPPIAGSASLESSPATSTGHEFPQNQGRRPSLPQIFDSPLHPAHSHSMSTSLAQGSSRHHGKSSGRPSFSSSRRPRSAGTDADTSVASASSTPGRLRGKLSLLSMFKKSAGESASSASSPGIAGGPTTPESRDSFTSSGYASASSSSALTSASASPTPEREHGGEHPRERSRGPSAHSPLRTRASEAGPLSSAPGSSSASIVAPALATVPSHRSRLGSTSESLQSYNSAVDAPFPPLAVELHRKLSMERLRGRSGSGSSSTQQQQSPGTPAEQRPAPAQSPSPQHPPLPLSQGQAQSQQQLQGHRSPAVRPGILRPHGRSASSGQSSIQLPEVRAAGEGSARSLRFEASSPAAASVSTKRSGLNLDLKASGSVSSLRGENPSATASPRSPWSASSQTRLRERERDPSVDATNHRHRNYTIIDDEDEDGYGEVISPRIGLGLTLPGEGKSRLNELKTEERQIHRQPSMNSQLSRESSTGSPLPSPTGPSESGFDCPFSINRPPPQPLPPDAAAAPSPHSSQSPPSSQSLSLGSQSRDNLLGIHGVDNRARGDSFGSMSTSTDASLPQTPGPGPVLGLEIRSPDAGSLDLPSEQEDIDLLGGDATGRSRADSTASRTNYLLEREHQQHQHQHRARTMSPPRSRAPALDIDIRAISSHAQAEALVQRAQKSILDMEDVDVELLPGFGLGLGVGVAGANPAVAAGGGTTIPTGRTPLSAKLAAYGESLAIERRFKEKEERERGGVRGFEGSPTARSPTRSRSGDGETPVGSPTTPRDRRRSRGSEFRKFSLEETPGRPIVVVPAPRRGKPRRPHTSDGKRASFVLICDCILNPRLGDTSDTTTAFLSPHKPATIGHKSSLSSSVVMSPQPTTPSPGRSAPIRHPVSSRTLPQISSPSSSDDRPPRIVRSRTPDPDGPYLDDPSPLSSGGSTFGVPLSRVSTAPPRHASPDIVTQRTLSEQERERARANKLMKMGLLVHDTFPRSHSPYGHARNGGGSGGGGSSGKQRFGGIKGFVQTLTGKT